MAVCNILPFIFLFLSWPTILSTNGASDVGNHNVSTCSSSQKGSGGLTIISKYGPCSPLGQGNLASYSTDIFLHDKNRVEAISANLNNMDNIYTTQDLVGGSKSTPVKIQPTPGASIYLVQVGFGSENRNFTLLLDTGSDLTWMQCQPCSGKCFHQNDPMFNPLNSSTFSKESCRPPEPIYKRSYLDNSTSSGYYGCDTLTISDYERYPDFLFGCGEDNSGDFGGAAGVFALGRGGSAAARFAQEFCFCLPVNPATSGYIYFGQEAQQKCKTAKGTMPLISGSGGHFYVNLDGISIGKTRLSISSYIYSQPATIIDSGTVITRLPQSVYSDLRSEFKKSMSNQTEAGTHENLDTCYNFKGYNNHYPKIPLMVLHFAGSKDIPLSRDAVLINIDNPQVYCLAFAAKDKDEDPIIIGSHQIRGLNMYHDIQKGILGYGKGNC